MHKIVNQLHSDKYCYTPYQSQIKPSEAIRFYPSLTWHPTHFSLMPTLFENQSKCLICIFDLWLFSTNFCPIKIDLSGNTVWPKASGFQNLAKFNILGIFNEILSTQNEDVTRFAPNVEWDFICDFQTPCDAFFDFSIWFDVLSSLPGSF